MSEIVGARFEILREAGSGGMGIVYQARDRLTGANVAIKVLGDRAHAARFAREAEVLAGLEHEAIVGYVAHGEGGAEPAYLAMEWLDGEDLATRLARGPLAIDEVVALIARLADAVGFAHGRGVIHRDLKPSNVFLPAGSVEGAKVLDFGLARDATSSRQLTAAGAVMGTVGYLSPEQARGSALVDARTDVFALGCIAFECVTGTAAFSGAHAVAVLAKLLVEDAPRVRSILPEVPSALDALVASMLERNPERRPRDGAAVREQLRALSVRNAIPPSLPPSAIQRAAALTRDEQRVMAVILVAERRRAGDTLADDASSAAEPTMIALRSEEGRGALAATVAPFDASADMTADGTVVVTLRGGAATDQATGAARCALALRRTCPGTAIALAIGRGVAGAASPSGEVIERAAALLARALRDPMDAVHVEPSVVPILESRFVLAPNASGMLLHAERQSFESARIVLGRVMPFVGRGHVLATLESAFASALLEPQALATVVVGAAGSGKSRLREELVRAVRRRDPNAVSWMVQGEPSRTQSPFGSIAPMLRAVCGVGDAQGDVAHQALASRLAQTVEATEREHAAIFLAEVMGCPFDAAASPALRLARESNEVMQRQITRAWNVLAAGEISRAPLLVVLEDIHWIDAASVQLVDAMLAAQREKPLMVLALGRPEVLETHPSLWAEHAVQTIRLTPLSARAAETIAREALAGTAVGEDAIARVVERAAGNPFVLEELLRALAERPSDDAAMPDGVLALVQTRLEALDPSLRRVLRAASIFGRSAPEQGVARLLGDEDAVEIVRSSLATLVRREVLETTKDDPRILRFRHDLVRDAAYAMLTDADRAVGHALAGAWLESAGERDAAVLAMHFERAGDPASAARWCARAAEQAIEGNDPAAAAAHATRAIDLGASGEILGRALCARAMSAQWTGSLAAGFADAREAMGLLDSGSATWFAAALRACVLGDAIGVRDEVAVLVERALEVEPRDARARTTRVRLIVEGVSARYHAGDSAGGDALAARLQREAAPLANDPLVELGLHRLGALHAAYSRDPAGELEHWEQIRACYERAGDRGAVVGARVSIGYVLMALGANERAEEELRRAIADAEALRLWRGAGAARHNLGLVLARRGQLEAAVREESAAIEAMVASKDERLTAVSRVYLAIIHDMAGDFERGEIVAREALRQTEGLPPLRPRALATLARIVLHRGRADEAERIAANAIRALAVSRVEEGEVLPRLVRAETLLAVGRTDEAKQALRDAKAAVDDAAAHIHDDSLRELFLRDVPENARVLVLAREHGV